MLSTAIRKCACMTSAAVLGFIGRTVASASVTTSHCDVFEYYDVISGACRHCDTACFEYENGTVVSFSESRCQQLCPGYIKGPRVPRYPTEPEEDTLTLMEGCLIGFVISLFLVCVLVLVVLRSEIYTAFKDCTRPTKGLPYVVSDVVYSQRADVSESSYVKLADPSDEVEIIERVTCV